MNSPVIETIGLTKLYGANRGIANVDLQVHSGEIFGFLGPNGAGKTTAIRILLDLIRPTSGSARVFGLDARGESIAIRNRTGYLPGEMQLYPNMTGAELLGYFGALRPLVNWQLVDQLTRRLQADLSRPIETLSQGNKRKVGLIQALMHRPELLILDEPTAGLDPLIQHEFLLLIEEASTQGQTVFISSHNLPEVERICHRVGMIRAGRLIAVEEIADLKRQAFRQVEIRFADPVPADAFSGLPGIHDLLIDRSILRCSVSGTIDPLIKVAARFEVEDFLSHEPNLEDIFLSLYSEKDDQTDMRA